MAFCSNCGAKIEEGAAFCTNCGTKVVKMESSQTVTSQETVQTQTQAQQNYQASATAGLDDDELLMRAFITGSVAPHSIEHNYEHYRKAFFKMDNGGSRLNWNWSAFWVAGWNLCYRKSYGFGILIQIVLYILYSVSYGVGFLLNLIPALKADSFAYSRYKENLAYAKRTFPNDIARQTAYMAEKGGVNKGVGIVAFLICIIYLIICFAIASEFLY